MRKRSTCVEVHDGDTFLTSGGVWVRLAGVNCPENGKWGSIVARRRLAGLILDRTIAYEPVGRSYHRIVANVWAGNRSVNRYMKGFGY